MSSKCNDFRCECCYPPLFQEEIAAAHNYDMNTLPFDIWGVTADELFNLSQEDIFNFQWVIVDDVREQERIIAHKQPYIFAEDWNTFSKAIRLVKEAA